MPANSPFQHVPHADLSLGEPGVFKQLYSEHHLAVFRYIFGLHGGPLEDVEDLASLTFLRAWRSRHRYRGKQDQVLSWLLKIARNLVIDSYRRKSNHPNLLDIEAQIVPEPGLNPEQQFAQREQIRILWRLLEKLPNQQREIIVLRYMLTWRVKDIAEHLNTNENNISVSIRRILQRIRREWPEP